MLAVLQKKGNLWRLSPSPWGRMGGHPSKAQNKGTTRLKQEQRAKIPQSKAQSPHMGLTVPIPVPFLISKMKAKLLSFIPESCFAAGTTDGFGFGSLCAGLPVPTWELSVGFLEPSWSLQRKKTKVGSNPSCRMVHRKSSGHPPGMEIHGTCHGNPPAPKTLTCWLQASNEISTLLGSQTCCQQHLCLLKKRT